MNESVLAIYPHPDDETIGKAGTLINHVENGKILFCESRNINRNQDERVTGCL